MEKAYGHDPVGYTPNGGHGAESGRDGYSAEQHSPAASPVGFSGLGDTAHGDVANEADRYSRPAPLTPASGPPTQNNAEVELEWVTDSELAPGCVRGFDY